MTVQAQAHQVPGPQRHVGVEERLLGDVADRTAPPPAVATLDLDPAGARSLQAEDHPEQRRLAGTVRPDETDELAGVELEGDPVEHLAAAQGDVDRLEPQHRVHSFSVEVLSTTARVMAWTSASIQVW